MVLCKQLECGTALKTLGSWFYSEETWPLNYSCLGSESSLTQCAYDESGKQDDCKGGQKASVLCSGGMFNQGL